MKALGLSVVLGLLLGAWAQHNALHLECDSPEVEEVAALAQDYINSQHARGYKYALNRIEHAQVLPKPNGDSVYLLELDLLETDCHVLDPTPVHNCTVRPKVLTAVEGDCDLVVTKAGGAFSVTAFKCKTEESTEDLCLGCQSLLPLNHTVALEFVHSSLTTFNNMSADTYVILDVGRMSTQVVSGGPIFHAEYVVAEGNCTDGACEPLHGDMAKRGICVASGRQDKHSVDCKMFPVQVPVAQAPTNDTMDANVLYRPPVFVHAMSAAHGVGFHRLTTLHDPNMSGLLSAESAESAEVVPVVAAAPSAAAATPAAAPAADAAAATDAAPAADAAQAVDAAADVAPAADAAADVAPAADAAAEVPKAVVKRQAEAVPVNIVAVKPLCPGRIRHF